MRGWIALEFVGMVTAALIYVGGPWAVVVIVVTAAVVFGLVGAPFGDG
ncbi:MAG: hypothetical protein JSS68_13090 [Actinobacteria bacterium]|nr:hypothetical protein [Actinomycetota bacterium]